MSNGLILHTHRVLESTPQWGGATQNGVDSTPLEKGLGWSNSTPCSTPQWGGAWGGLLGLGVEHLWGDFGLLHPTVGWSVSGKFWRWGGVGWRSQIRRRVGPTSSRIFPFHCLKRSAAGGKFWYFGTLKLGFIKRNNSK